MRADLFAVLRRVLLGAVLALPLAPLAAGAEERVAVLTSPDIAAPPMDRATLQAIFLMRLRQWPDGRPIHVFVLPESNPVHERFAREKLGTYPYILRRVWDRMLFTGTGSPPEVVGDEQRMRDRLSHTPGAIGYVSADKASALDEDLQRTQTGDLHALR